MSKKTIIIALLALIASAGQGQTTDTLRLGMEMKLQNAIGTSARHSTERSLPFSIRYLSTLTNWQRSY